MEKLVFKKPVEKKAKDFGDNIRISRESADIVEEISAKIGKTKSYVASKMIKYAYEHCEIVDSEEE